MEPPGDTHTHIALLKSLCSRERHTQRLKLDLLAEIIQIICSKHYAVNYTSYNNLQFYL